LRVGDVGADAPDRPCVDSGAVWGVCHGCYAAASASRSRSQAASASELIKRLLPAW
jgi:hypothetical protein